MIRVSARRALITGTALALFSGAAAAAAPICDVPALAESLKAIVENIEEIKAANMAAKEVRGFAEVSYDQGADVRISKAEAELANAQIIDLTITFNLNPETGGYVPKVEYAPGA